MRTCGLSYQIMGPITVKMAKTSFMRKIANLQLEVQELVPVQVIMGEELVLVHRFQQIHHVEVEELAILGCLLFN